MPAAMSTSEGSMRRQGRLPSRFASRQFEHTAMTTGSVPMIMVGSGPPARWIAADSSR